MVQFSLLLFDSVINWYQYNCLSFSQSAFLIFQLDICVSSWDLQFSGEKLVITTIAIMEFPIRIRIYGRFTAD